MGVEAMVVVPSCQYTGPKGVSRAGCKNSGKAQAREGARQGPGPWPCVGRAGLGGITQTGVGVVSRTTSSRVTGAHRPQCENSERGQRRGERGSQEASQAAGQIETR